MYFEIFHQMRKQLGQIDKWLEKAAAHADARKFDAGLFLGFRLAPDQFAFGRQVQLACDTAKLAASRLTGKEAPVQSDADVSLEELSARIRTVVAFLEGLSEKDFGGAAERSISQPRWEGKTMTGADYFVEHALPNFYFHLAHAYAVLRHNGVPVGKRDYLGVLTQRAPAA